jgi:hypothetical protein
MGINLFPDFIHSSEWFMGRKALPGIEAGPFAGSKSVRIIKILV